MMRILLWGLLCSLTPLCLYGQEVSDVLEWMTEQNAEDPSRLEALNDYYMQLASAPLNINLATENDLGMVGVLSAFQIASFMEYRKTYGPLYSWNEVQLIPGFTPQVAQLLKPFFSVEMGTEPEKMGWKPLLQYGKHTLLLSTKNAWSRYLRYLYMYKDRLRWGFTLESDAGERAWVDYASWHIQYNGKGKLKSLLIGDYQVRFGMGLLLSSGTSFSSSFGGRSSLRYSKPLMPYTSKDENRFLRGVACSWGSGSWELTVFGSYRRLDARVVEDGYTSLGTDGYHRTVKEVEKKNALGAWVTGARLSFWMQSAVLALSAGGYGYNKPFAGTVYYYNKDRVRRTPFAGVSVDGAFRWASWRLNTEVAMDAAFHPSAVAELRWSTPSMALWTLILRAFSSGYTSPYGGVLGRNSTSSNEQSLQVTGFFPMALQWHWNVDAYFYRFPKPSYGCREPSYGCTVLSSLENHWLSVRGRYQKSADQQMASLRLQGKWKTSKGFTGTVRAECKGVFQQEISVQKSALVYSEVKYRTRNETLSTSFRATAYYAPTWDSRLYAYETDVLYGFSVPALYGKDIRLYLVFKFSPWPWMDLWAKGALDVWGKKKELKVQLRFRW